jgi:RimJ/RimL family protein N-acetyltransferase
VRLEDVWPLFGLRLVTPRLELRLVRDEDLPGLLGAARHGIHDPEVMPFGVPWTDASGDDLRRSFLQHQWRLRAGVRPDDWALNLAVLVEGEPVGVQDLVAANFGVLRTVTSGSWLTRSRQGQGLGKEMRAAVLIFAFDHLGAEVAESSAATWNQSSLAVSRAMGYAANGVARVSSRPGEMQIEQRVRLERDAFVRPDWQLRVEGLAPALKDLLGRR